MNGSQNLALKYFKDLVREKAGLTFDNTREEILRQKIAEVIGQKGYKSRTELYSVLQNNNNEFLDFVNHLTINETYFFREPQYLKLLTNHLVPELLTKRGQGTKLKILSAGCSTGEEPYSIAMSLLEKYGANTGKFFSLIGIDIDSVALAKATRGDYGNLSFRNNEGLLQARYFDKVNGNLFKIKPFVKELASFQRVNLLNHAFPKELHGVDIVFYRNVSIYFDAATQQKILSGLASLLNDDGYVIFSSSETFSHKDSEQLTLIEQQGLFCYQKRRAILAEIKEPAATEIGPASRLMQQLAAKGRDQIRTRLPQSMQEKVPGSRQIEHPLQKTVDTLPPEEMFARAVDFYRKKEHEQTLALVEKLKKSEKFAGKAYLLEGCILLNTKKTADAEIALGKALLRDELDLDAHMMLGLISKNTGKTWQALQSFHKALYVKHSCWMAHYFLAEIHQNLGDEAKAERHYDKVLKIMELGSAESEDLTFFPISFRRQDLMHLCRQKLALLRA